MAARNNQLAARLPRGLADRSAADLRASDAMLATIRRVYESYGFEPVETPVIEYTDALGKFLPDLDRPNEGVFSFRDDDEQWLSLRYDLTAPLARHVAENFDRLPKPYRTYRAGWVFRNEKPGPGRFRQFMQFDADTVGSKNPASDAEMCMMAADTMEALGIERGQYMIRVSSRKILDGLMETAGLAGPENTGRRLIVLRAIDKLDRLGWEGVEQLLGKGRRDESGDFTKGAELSAEQILTLQSFFFLSAAPGYRQGEATKEAFGKRPVKDFWTRPAIPENDPGSEFKNIDADGPRLIDNLAIVDAWQDLLSDSAAGVEGARELRQLIEAAEACGYGSRRIQLSSFVVRGLEYYTGAVFEASLEFEVPNEKGEKVVFGSVGGGGRYDGLVGRFRGEDVPATGFSIGVSRLQAALNALKQGSGAAASGPIVVTVMEKERIGDYLAMAAKLRRSGLPAEIYLGDSGMKAQLKYADRRNSPCVVIQGSDEREKGLVQIKDLAEGKRLAEGIADNQAWREARAGQVTVPESELVPTLRRLLGVAQDEGA